MLLFLFRKEIMQYSIENDGVYKVEIIGKVALKTLVLPKDILLEAAKQYKEINRVRNNSFNEE